MLAFALALLLGSASAEAPPGAGAADELSAPTPPAPSGGPTAVGYPSLGALSPTVPPGHWMIVPLWVRGATVSAEVEAVLPVMRFALVGGTEVVERRLETLFVKNSPGEPYVRPALKLVKGPDREGQYAVTVEFRVGLRSLGTADLGTVEVVSLGAYALQLGALLTVLSGALVLMLAGRPRPRRAAWLVMLLTVFVFGRWLLGGHTVFLGLVIAIAIVARRAHGPLAFLSRASLVLALFDELYWGDMVNGARWTGLVISVSLIALIGIGLARIVRSPAVRAYGGFVLACSLTWLYVATSIYKSFFLDIPAISVAGDAGQVGRLLDSVLLAFKITHMLALVAPFGVLATYGWLTWRARRLGRGGAQDDGPVSV